MFLFGHLRVDDAASGAHPLYTAGLNNAAVPGTVFMAHSTGEQISHGLEPAMGVSRKAGNIVIRII